MSELCFVDAVSREHFSAMSLIHALGWRTTYADAIPADFMSDSITDDRWTTQFEDDYKTGRCHGILLCSDGTPVSCATYGPARIGVSPHGGGICEFHSENYRGWGEVISFYTHPSKKSAGYGGILMKEIVKRLKLNGFAQCYVFVLRENLRARQFYERHGFTWDGTHEEIPFPHETLCVDLRYVRRLDSLD